MNDTLTDAYALGYHSGRGEAYTLDRDEAVVDNYDDLVSDLIDQDPNPDGTPLGWIQDYARGYIAGYDREAADPAADWTDACEFNGHRQTDNGRCANCRPPVLGNAPDPNARIAADEAARLDAHDAYMDSDERILLEERFGDELDEMRRIRRYGTEV